MIRQRLAGVAIVLAALICLLLAVAPGAAIAPTAAAASTQTSYQHVDTGPAQAEATPEFIVGERFEEDPAAEQSKKENGEILHAFLILAVVGPLFGLFLYCCGRVEDGAFDLLG